MLTGPSRKSLFSALHALFISLETGSERARTEDSLLVGKGNGNFAGALQPAESEVMREAPFFC